MAFGVVRVDDADLRAEAGQSRRQVGAGDYLGGLAEAL